MTIEETILEIQKKLQYPNVLNIHKINYGCSKTETEYKEIFDIVYNNSIKGKPYFFDIIFEYSIETKRHNITLLIKDLDNLEPLGVGSFILGKRL